MAIETVGSFYLDDVRFSPASLGIAKTNPDTSTESKESFSSMLEKAEAYEEQQKPASKKPAVDKTDKLYEQCEALETFLIKNLLNSMRSTVQKSGFIDEGFAGKMYEDMLYDEYAKDYTKH
jgi:flagellar protein FlgJ